MALSSGELKHPTMEQLKKQLEAGKSLVTTATPHEAPHAARNVFRGLIYEELIPEDEDDEVEKDGGGFSKHKTHQTPPAPSKHDIKWKRGTIKMLQAPSLEEPGKLSMTETGQTIEFYYGRDVLEATDAGSVLTGAVIEDTPDDAKFKVISESKTTSGFVQLVNIKDNCVCLSLKGPHPVLVSISQDEIKRLGSKNIVQYITIFESSTNCIALYFTHENAKSRIFNYYLTPNHSSTDRTSSVAVTPKDVTSLSDKDQIAVHKQFLFFSNNPQGEEDQADFVPIHRRLLTTATSSSSSSLDHSVSPSHLSRSHDNGDSTPSLESSDESRDSGCGQSTKGSRGNSIDNKD